MYSKINSVRAKQDTWQGCDDPPRLGISLRYHYSGTQVQEAVLPQRHWNTSAVQQMFTADMPMRSVFSESTLTSEK